MIKIMALGDIFGRPGRNMIINRLDSLKREYEADFVIVNIENASAGSGVTEANAKELLAVKGVDVYTSGNHIWDKKDINNLIQESDRLLRPANYPLPCPGRGYEIYRCGKYRIGVVNLSGTSFMENLDNPFITFDTIHEIIAPACDIICVDFHAEATSEKIAFGYHADGRASVVYGTHTHVQTADERVLKGGCGYITDIGMCGPIDGVIGVDKNIIVKNFVTQRRSRYEVADGPVQLNGALFTIDDSMRCISVERIRRIFD